MHVHGAVLGTAVQCRYCLAGVEQILGVEGVLDLMELDKFVRGKLRAHLIQLLDADTVLTGDGAAHLQTQL